MTIFLLLAILPSLMYASGSKSIPANAEEGFFTLSYSGLETEISTYIIEDKNYLPLLNIMSFLKIYFEAENNFELISGFFINTDDKYKIDFSKKEFELKQKIIPIEDDDFYIDRLEVFVSESFLNKTFGIQTLVSLLRLKIEMASDEEMPILLEKNREKEYKFLKKGGERYSPLEFDKSFNIINGGILSYDVSYRQQKDRSQSSTYRFDLGAELLGGGFNMNTHGYFDFQRQENRMNNNYSLRYMFQNEYLTQLTFGHLQYMNSRSAGGSSMNIRDEQLLGVMISNEKAMFHSDYYTDLTFRDYLGPGWLTEIYLNGSLFNQMRTGEDGYYNFAVPINYGLSEVEMKYYGPLGEYYEMRRSYNILNSFLPPGDIKYTLWGGQSVFGGDYIANADASLGVFPWLATSMRANYNYNSRSFDFMNQLTASLIDNLVLSLAYSPSQGVNAGFNFNSYQSYFTLNYSNPLKEIDGAGKWSTSNRSLFCSFNQLFGLPLSFGINGTHSLQPKQESLNISSSISSSFNSISLRARYRSSYTMKSESPRDPLHQTEFSASYFFHSLREALPFIDYNRLELSGGYDIMSRAFTSSSLSISASLFRFININIGISKDFISNRLKSSVGLSMNSQLFRSNSQLAFDDGNFNNASQSLQGVVAFDPQTVNLSFSNSNPYNLQYGVSGANIRFFRDLNNNNEYDKGEPIIDGVKIKMDNNRSGGMVYKDGFVTVNNLVPNYRYNVSVDMKSLKDPVWLPKYVDFSFITDANSYKAIDVPCYSTGIIEGKVMRFVAGKYEAQNRVRIHIVNSETDYRDMVPVFTDGSYYKLGIMPGKYIAYVDSMQLAILGVVSAPPFREFNVKSSESGDFIDGINFELIPIDSVKRYEDYVKNYLNMIADDQEVVKSENKSEIDKIISDSEKFEDIDIIQLRKLINEDSNIVDTVETTVSYSYSDTKTKDSLIAEAELAKELFPEKKPVPKPKLPDIELNIVKTFSYKATNDYKLTSDIIKYLNDAAAFLAGNIHATVSIVGHTDSFGSLEQTQEISEKRAKAAEEYLLKKGIDKFRIYPRGDGARNPISSNTTPQGRKKNRRIEIQVLE